MHPYASICILFVWNTYHTLPPFIPKDGPSHVCKQGTFFRLIRSSVVLSSFSCICCRVLDTSSIQPGENHGKYIKCFNRKGGNSSSTWFASFEPANKQHLTEKHRKFKRKTIEKTRDLTKSHGITGEQKPLINPLGWAKSP